MRFIGTEKKINALYCKTISYMLTFCVIKERGMFMDVVKIGVDIGNYDTKTQHCQIASGYKRYDVKPEIVRKVLSYKGSYFALDDNERMPYVVDKTKNDQCLILTLMGIAEELIYLASDKKDNLQEEIDKVKEIKLGLGLPPGHFTKYSLKTLNYYKNNLEGLVEFTYKNCKFSFIVSEIKIFPQDFVAVYKNPNCQTAKKKRYYIIGIGGGTVDVVPVVNGQPDANKCFSLESGTRVMYREIAADIQRQYGQMPDEALIEDVLKDEDTSLPEPMIKLIREDAKLHYEKIINGIAQQGVKLSLYPSVFFGGGALLFKSFINADENISEREILEDTKANAKAYAACIK